MLSIITALILAGDFTISPNVTLPPELEVCILQAEVCVQALRLPLCGQRLPNLDAAKQCSAAYEDCSYPFPETKESACRLDYVWCVIAATADVPDEYLKYCGEVAETCPST